jgi:hypothetical protein
MVGARRLLLADSPWLQTLGRLAIVLVLSIHQGQNDLSFIHAWNRVENVETLVTCSVRVKST